MKIYKLDTESDFEKLDLCLAIGNFDGIHKGHQEIINKIKEIASNNNLLSSIMSFNPHPRTFFNQINEPFNIYTQSDKIIVKLIKKKITYLYWKFLHTN